MSAVPVVSGNDMLMVQMLANLKKPLVANVRQGARVLIITDTRHDPLVWQVAAMAVDDLGGEPTVALITPREIDYQSPPDSVVSALKCSDLGLLLTTTAMFHSDGVHEAMAGGTPVIAMDGGMTREMYTTGAVTADYRLIKEINREVALGVFGEDPDEIRMTSQFGTDLRCSIKGRMVIPGRLTDSYVPLQVERFSESDDFGAREGSTLYGFPFPGGEVNTAPIENSGEGVLVVDTTMHGLGKLDQPIKLTINAGRIKKIEGGHQAERLRRNLLKYGDEAAWQMPTEFSVGTNYAAQVVGIQREDKNILGCVHVGLGRNDDVGGSLYSNMHADAVVLRPTVYVDGEMKIDNGHVPHLERLGLYERINAA